MKTTTRLVLAAALALLCAPAQSQTMYRCGKVYQDRPCDAGVKGKAVGSTGVQQGAPQAAVDAECAQRGKDSNKIVWAREGGASEQRLVLEARSGAEQQFIRDIYRRPGSASTVQAAVQAECVAEKERAKEAAALQAAAAAAALLKGLSPPAETPNPAAEAQARRKNELAQQHAAGDAARRTENCARYKQQLDTLRSQERIDAPTAQVESLNAQRRELRELMSRAGC
jgi:hypothetical protein